MQSIGFNPARFERRVKMLMLMRLVPFVESNYNLIELGPRETGKTYTFRNTSNRAFVVSGGKATPATLFYNKASRKLGVIGLKQLVFFDEIANTRFDDAEASISMLKDYMQTGKFSRGDQEFTAPCSVVLGGNIDTNLELRQPDTDTCTCFRSCHLNCKTLRSSTASTPTCQAGRCLKSARRTTPSGTDC